MEALFSSLNQIEHPIEHNPIEAWDPKDGLDKESKAILKLIKAMDIHNILKEPEENQMQEILKCFHYMRYFPEIEPKDANFDIPTDIITLIKAVATGDKEIRQICESINGSKEIEEEKAEITVLLELAKKLKIDERLIVNSIIDNDTSPETNETKTAKRNLISDIACLRNIYHHENRKLIMYNNEEFKQVNPWYTNILKPRPKYYTPDKRKWTTCDQNKWNYKYLRKNYKDMKINTTLEMIENFNEGKLDLNEIVDAHPNYKLETLMKWIRNEIPYEQIRIYNRHLAKLYQIYKINNRSRDSNYYWKMARIDEQFNKINPMKKKTQYKNWEIKLVIQRNSN